MILIDTTPLVALCDARDSKHRLAVKQLEAFESEELAVCDAVITESCFHLPHRSKFRLFKRRRDDKVDWKNQVISAKTLLVLHQPGELVAAGQGPLVKKSGVTIGIRNVDVEIASFNRFRHF